MKILSTDPWLSNSNVRPISTAVPMDPERGEVLDWADKRSALIRIRDGFPDYATDVGAKAYVLSTIRDSDILLFAWAGDSRQQYFIAAPCPASLQRCRESRVFLVDDRQRAIAALSAAQRPTAAA